MIIIGERLNSSRKAIRLALENRDEDFLIKEALNQVKAGAHYLDVNVSALAEQEIELMKWLVPLIQSRIDLPLSIDSPNPEAGASPRRNPAGRRGVRPVRAHEPG